MAPCLFCLYTTIVIFYDTMPWSNSHLRVMQWTGKRATTFSDMIENVRRHLWMEWIFAQVPSGEAVQKLSKPTRAALDFGLAQAT